MPTISDKSLQLAKTLVKSLGLNEVARQCEIDRSQLSRALAAGQLSLRQIDALADRYGWQLSGTKPGIKR